MKSRNLPKAVRLLIIFLCFIVAGYGIVCFLEPSDEEVLAEVVQVTGVVAPDPYQELAVYQYDGFVDSGTVVYVKFSDFVDLDRYALESRFHKVDRFFDHPLYTYGKEIPWIEELPKEHQRSVPREGAIYKICSLGLQCSSYRGIISVKARAMWLYVAW